ncbi:MAG: hypothetical protein AAF824_12120 [Bacteroidota bacterium]
MYIVYLFLAIWFYAPCYSPTPTYEVGYSVANNFSLSDSMEKPESHTAEAPFFPFLFSDGYHDFILEK